MIRDRDQLRRIARIVGAVWLALVLIWQIALIADGAETTWTFYVSAGLGTATIVLVYLGMTHRRR
jgi:hypothetical protein